MPSCLECYTKIIQTNIGYTTLRDSRPSSAISALMWVHCSQGSFLFWSMYLYGSLCKVQSTLVISNSKVLSEILRDIRTSTYQSCRIEEKIIRTTTFNKYICNWTLEVTDILKILWKRGEIALRSNSSSFPQYFLPVVRFSCLGKDQIFTSRQAVIRDKRGRDNKSRLCCTAAIKHPSYFTLVILG